MPKLILVITTLLFFGQHLLAQSANQWRVSKLEILDFQQSPPLLYRLGDSVLGEWYERYQRTYFELLASNKQGQLSYTGFKPFFWEQHEYRLVFRDALQKRLPFKLDKPDKYFESAFNQIYQYQGYLTGQHVNIAFNNGNTFLLAVRKKLDYISVNRASLHQDTVFIKEVDTISIAKFDGTNLQTFTYCSKHSFYYNLLYRHDADENLYVQIRKIDKNGLKIAAYDSIQVSDQQINYFEAMVPQYNQSGFALFGKTRQVDEETQIEYNSSLIDYYQLDTNGKVLSKKRYSITDELHLGSLRGASFSANDSFLYASFGWNYDLTETPRKGGYFFRINLAKGIVENIDYKHKDSVYVRKMGVAPNGKLYFQYYAQDSGNYTENGLGVIHFPEATVNAIDMRPTGMTSVPELFTYYFEGIEPHYNINQNFVQFKALQAECTDTFIRLHNYSENHFVKFVWQLMDTDSTVVDEQAGHHPILHPPQTGKYYVRAQGIGAYGRNTWRWQQVNYVQPPKVNFALPKDTFCRYEQLNLTAQVQQDTIAEKRSYTWQVSHKQESQTANGSTFATTFTKTGKYSIKLSYKDGICSNIYSYTQDVWVIDAPKTGFAIDDDSLCTQQKIIVSDSSSGVITSSSFIWSDGMEFTNSQTHSRYFEQPGKYWLYQKLKGTTHCTSVDSAQVIVNTGFTLDSIPRIYSVTVTDQQAVAINYRYMPSAAKMYLLRYAYDSIMLDSFAASSYLDHLNQAINQAYSYRIFAIDSCGNSSPPSALSRSVFLQAQNQNNDFVQLSWTAYATWNEGVASYHIEQSSDGIHWQELNSLSAASRSKQTAVNTEQDSVYYRIKAVENNGFKQIAYSNVVKINSTTTLFVPNAFSPNNDGINDVLKIGTFGLANFNCEVYSSKGQLLAQSNLPNDIWNGKTPKGIDCPTGSYYLVITATNSQGKAISHKEWVHLFR